MRKSGTVILLCLLHTMFSSILYSAERTYIKGMPAGLMTIDGLANEMEWESAEWYPINAIWLGRNESDNDFKGDYKVLWDSSALYILARIRDDIFFDHYSDPLTSYWKDDCLEVFVDEDFSGGDHKHNYNAFAYHISMTYDVVDLGIDGKPHLFNDNLEVMRTNIGNEYLWEIRMPLYTDAYVYGAVHNPVKKLIMGDTIGLSLAYCDNDGGNDREGFIGSVEIESADKNTSWKDAGVFGALVLENPNLDINDINNFIDIGSVSVYPNPFTDRLFLKEVNKCDLRLRIFSSDGRLVHNAQTTKNLKSIYTAQLAAGIYIIHIIDYFGYVYMDKFIKVE